MVAVVADDRLRTLKARERIALRVVLILRVRRGRTQENKAKFLSMLWNFPRLQSA